MEMPKVVFRATRFRSQASNNRIVQLGVKVVSNKTGLKNRARFNNQLIGLVLSYSVQS